MVQGKGRKERDRNGQRNIGMVTAATIYDVVEQASAICPWSDACIAGPSSCDRRILDDVRKKSLGGLLKRALLYYTTRK